MVFPLVCNQYHYIRRGKIWIFLSNARKVALDYNIDIFSKLLNFKDYEIDNFIRKDIERTILISFNSSQYKKVEFDSVKKDNLFNVLKAYSVYDKDVGYCQGTNFIVGILNTNIPSKRYVFWTFVNIMNSNKWRELYISDTPKLLRMIDILVNLIKTRLPLLFDHFIKQDV